MKVVLTGGPSSGKSTLIEMLKYRGFNTIPEVAKDIINKVGLISPERREDYINMQKLIALEQLKREENLDDSKITILDRGIYDNIIYCEKNLSFIPKEVKMLIDSHQGYDQIFLLERLPFTKSDFRIEESDLEANDLHERVKEVYERNGYKIETVPILPKAERLKYLIKKIGDI